MARQPTLGAEAVERHHAAARLTALLSEELQAGGAVLALISAIIRREWAEVAEGPGQAPLQPRMQPLLR